jgi:DNA-binding response OmpR family regulator
MAKVLVVEDDEHLALNIKSVLESLGFKVEHIANGRDALQLLKSFPFDAIVLDINLPGTSGINVCQTFRKDGGKTPILMLTGNTDIGHKTQGFGAGADDYLTKPFDQQELVLRVRALLRRGSQGNQDVLSFGNLTLDTVTCSVVAAGTVVKLRPKEYLLLEYFMRNPGKIVSAENIKEGVWTSDEDASVEAVRVWIHRLRQKLSEYNSAITILNVPGFGYKSVASDV